MPGYTEMTVEAVLYLTAVMEYLLSEILELALQTALSMTNVTTLASRHIMMVLAGDDELRTVFPGIIRGSGRLPLTSWAGSSTGFVFDHVGIYRLCRDTLKGDIDAASRQFSIEAVLLIQTIIEEYLLDVVAEIHRTGKTKSGNHSSLSKNYLETLQLMISCEILDY
jgi:hypothetical protein